MADTSMGKGDLQGGLAEVLGRINEEGGFFASVIADEEGLSLAEVDSNDDYDINTITAVSTLLQMVIQRAESQRMLSRVDEVSFIDTHEKTRLVGRYFSVRGHKFVLVVLVPAGKSYRRLINRAISEIGLILSQVIE